MNLEKTFDVRFLAPVGVMVFFVFLYSPQDFLLKMKDFSDLGWVASVVGILGVGFMISSIGDFVMKLVLEHPGDWESEVKIWRDLHLEREKHGEEVPAQIHKRWSMAAANFNACIAMLISFVIAYKYLSIPSYKESLVFMCIFLFFFFSFFTME